MEVITLTLPKKTNHLSIDEIKNIKYDSRETTDTFRKLKINKEYMERFKNLRFFPVYLDEDKDIIYFFTSAPQNIQEIRNFIRDHFYKDYRIVKVSDAILNSFLTHFDTDKRVKDVKIDIKNEVNVDESNIKRLANSILADAIARHASDIHIEISDKLGTIKFRINGIMIKNMEVPISDAMSLIRSFLIDSQLNVSELVSPQDGMFQKEIDGEMYSFRVSTIGTFSGTGYSVPTLVIRILYRNASRKFETLGFSEYQLQQFRKMMNKEGIIIITGPTGSGKTTTLYSFLDSLDLSDKKVISVEDPPEIPSDKIVQIKIMPERNITWGTALRTALRQDPDIILIGEIRTKEAAETAIQAANTGHTVLTTIHTNGVESIVERFLQIAGKDNPSVTPETLSYTLTGLISQRLVKRIKVPVKVALDNETRKKLEDLNIIDYLKDKDFITAPNGSVIDPKAGVYKGYDMSQNGRTVIAEVIANNSDFIRVLRKKDPFIIRDYLDRLPNHVTLIKHAFEKVNRGEIYLNDIIKYIAEVQISSKNNKNEVNEVNV